ncbi:MAG TPA: anhydro-N-acetylmuramic acid kinase [Cellulomonas sp.]
MPYAIGLNSGSSFDGVDAVLVELDLAADGQVAPPRYVDALSIDWPQEVQQQVLAAFADDLGIFALTRLNYVCGAVFAQAAREIMARHALTGADVDVIGFDGQTVYQEPPEPARMATADQGTPLHELWTEHGYPCGLQIGEPGVVAVLTDVPVVSQFRSVDHALGGTGAPLMQYLDHVLFRDRGPIATLNIGGISNIQVADADRSRMRAFDCGPGNVMIDHAVAMLYGRAYDRDGEVAARGGVDETMLAELLRHPFFDRPIPRCAWRLDFGAEYATGVLDRYAGLADHDKVATLTAFSAEAIVRAYRANVPEDAGIDELVASGGGVRNSTLMRMIADRLPAGVALVTSDAYGIPPQYKEAVKFATIAFATKRGIADNIPAASGARRFGVLGKLVQAPGSARGVDER